MRKVQSSHEPNLFERFGEKVYIRRNVEQKEYTMDMGDETETHSGFEYEEMLLEGYSDTFINENLSNIWQNPENYNVIQINGLYTQKHKG